MPASGDNIARLDKGSLLFEIDAPVRGQGGQTLIDLRSEPGRNMDFFLKLTGNGAVRLRYQKLDMMVPFGATDWEQPLHVSFVWDKSAHKCRLDVECLESGDILTVSENIKIAVPTDLIQVLSRTRDPEKVSGAVVMFALSNEVAPISHLPSIEASSPVETPDGWRPIEDLAVGDLVLIDDHEAQPVRKITSREVPAIGHFQPLRIRAPFFGLAQDVLVAPHQSLVIHDDLVEYLFAEERVLVEAGQLSDGSAIFPEHNISTVRYVQLIFDDHVILNVAGAEMSSQFNPEAGAAEGDPIHEELACPSLRRYEALTLRSMRNG